MASLSSCATAPQRTLTSRSRSFPSSRRAAANALRLRCVLVSVSASLCVNKCRFTVCTSNIVSVDTCRSPHPSSPDLSISPLLHTHTHTHTHIRTRTHTTTTTTTTTTNYTTQPQVVVKSQFKEKLFATNVELRIPTPPATAEVHVTTI
eukprot:Opistho-2@14870